MTASFKFSKCDFFSDFQTLWKCVIRFHGVEKNLRYSDFFSGRKTRQSMSSLNADLQKLLQMLLFSLWWCTMFFSLLQKTRNKSEVDFRESNLMRRNFWCSSVHFSGFWNFSSLLSLKADKYERECIRWFKITEKVSFNLASEASYVYILWPKKCFQTGHF